MTWPARSQNPTESRTKSSLNIVILGDSNTELGGDDCSRPKGWNKWFRDRLEPASCRSYARSGATWSNTPKTKVNVTEHIGRIGHDNVIFNQINRLIEAHKGGTQPSPDAIIIAAGTNDAWFAKSRPAAFALSVDEAFGICDAGLMRLEASSVVSLAQSVRYGCLLLKKHFPTSRIILLTPLQSSAVKGDGIRRTGDLIEGVGRRMELDVIRQDKVCCVKSEEEAVRYTHTYDGTHTSELGAEKNGEILAELIGTLLSGSNKQ